jgi:hypothetical protein
MKNEHKNVCEKVQRLESEKENLQAEILDAKKTSDSLSKELANSEKKRKRSAIIFKENLKKIQSEFIEPLRYDVESSKTSAQKEIDFLKNSTTDAVNLISKNFEEQHLARQNISSSETEKLKNEFEKKMENSETERRNLTEKIQNLQIKISKNEELTKNLQFEQSEVQKNYDIALEKCLTLEENLKSSVNKNTSLDSEIRQFMQKNKELEEKIADSREEVGKLNSEIIKLKRKTLQNEELTRMEMDQTKNRAFDLENEMRNLQFELLSKEDLLRNSVPVGDLKDLQEKNENLLQENRNLSSKTSSQNIQFQELKNYCAELEESQKKTIENIKIESESKIASLENQLFNLSNRNVDQNRIYDLEEEISIERQKAKTAMELARKEIAAVEERFRAVLEEKEEILLKSRSIGKQPFIPKFIPKF